MGTIELAQDHLKKLDQELAKFKIGDSNQLVMIESSFYLVDKALEKLKKEILDFDFKDEEEEINFFKNYMTEFLSRSNYYSELFHIESERQGGEDQHTNRFYLEKMEEVNKYFQRYAALNNYLILGKSYLDRVYFLRGAEAPLIYPDLFRHTLDSSFCTVYTLHFARLKAMEKLMNYLSDKVSVEIIEGQRNRNIQDHGNSLFWTGSKVDLVELIYALKTTAVVNHGSASVADLAIVMGGVFGKKLKDYYKTFGEIRERKAGKTFFLDRCKKTLNAYIEEFEGKE